MCKSFGSNICSAICFGKTECRHCVLRAFRLIVWLSSSAELTVFLLNFGHIDSLHLIFRLWLCPSVSATKKQLNNNYRAECTYNLTCCVAVLHYWSAQLIDSVVERLIVCLIDRLIDRLIDWLIDHYARMNSRFFTVVFSAPRTCIRLFRLQRLAGHRIHR